MADKTYWESFKAEGGAAIEKLKALIHEGNVRRIVIQHEGRNVAEFPLTAGIVGAVLAIGRARTPVKRGSFSSAVLGLAAPKGVLAELSKM